MLHQGNIPKLSVKLGLVSFATVISLRDAPNNGFHGLSHWVKIHCVRLAPNHLAPRQKSKTLSIWGLFDFWLSANLLRANRFGS